MDLKGKQIIYVENKPYIKCGVAISPAKKSKIAFYDKVLVEKRNCANDYREDCVIKPQHLYITSDEEIKEGEYFLTNQNDYWKIQKCQKICDDGMIMSFEEEIAMFQEDTYFVFKPELCKKILTTTDKFLGLPQPSQQFIEKFIEEHNKGNQITEVLVKVEEKYIESKLSYISAGGMVGFDKCELKNKRIGSVSCGECENYIQDFGNYITCKKGKKEYKLKLDSHNQITIRKKKNVWYREEVIELLHKSLSCNVTSSEKLNKVFHTQLDKWIEENL